MDYKVTIHELKKACRIWIAVREPGLTLLIEVIDGESLHQVQLTANHSITQPIEQRF